jgi:hypothetical protein
MMTIPTAHRTWPGPIAMGLLTATGLATALVSDTWGDWWSWVGLGVPTLAMAWFAWRPAAPAHPPAPAEKSSSKKPL